MNINKRARVLVGALALAGSVAFAGNAFTAGGLNASAGDNGYIGGTDTATIVGASLVSVAYTVDEAGNEIDSVLLTFAAGSNGKDVAIAFNGGTAGSYTCIDVADNASTCTAVTAASTDASNLSITVGTL